MHGPSREQPLTAYWCCSLGFEKFGWVSFASQTKVSKFVEYLEAGKIYGTKCLECGIIQFPPRAYCSQCLSSNFEWKQLSGDCSLITFTKVDAAPSTFKEQAPYLLGLAQFSEGPKVLAWIDQRIPMERLKAGRRLKLKPSRLENGNISYVLTSQDR